MIDLSLYNEVFTYSVLDEALQELDILFSTYNTELIGNVSFGTNFDQFMWSLTPEEDSIKRYILDKLAETTYITQTDYDVEVQYFNTPEIDPFYYVAITMRYQGEEKTKTYQLNNN